LQPSMYNLATSLILRFAGSVTCTCIIIVLQKILSRKQVLACEISSPGTEAMCRTGKDNIQNGTANAKVPFASWRDLMRWSFQPSAMDWALPPSLGWAPAPALSRCCTSHQRRCLRPGWPPAPDFCHSQPDRGSRRLHLGRALALGFRWHSTDGA
jgi:hypothetical protein